MSHCNGACLVCVRETKCVIHLCLICICIYIYDNMNTLFYLFLVVNTLCYLFFRWICQVLALLKYLGA
jgi:hypothetical protein